MLDATLDRRQLLLRDIDPARARGLEIGALHHPVLAPGTGVLYVDHASTADLRSKYADDPDVGEIVDVDVVWGDEPLRRALDAALGEAATVDYVVASHVVEHVPDLVGWLGELASALRAGGVVSLAVPDKRFCFDARRRVSDVAEVIDAHLSRRTRPSLAATFDFWTKYDAVDTTALWAGAEPPAPVGLRDAEALERTRVAAGAAEYRDVHNWVFTPVSFVEVLGRLVDLDLVPWFELHGFVPTRPGELEFFVTLVRVDEGADGRLARQQASVARFAGPSPAAEPPVSGLASTFAVSRREQRLIELKRRVVNRLRNRHLRRG